MARKKVFGTGLTGQQIRLWETFLFLSKVLVLSLPLYFIIFFSVSLTPLQDFDAFVSSGILRVMGYAVQQDGRYMTVGTQDAFSFYLTEDCTAWKSFLFFFALVFSVPNILLRKRLTGLAFGIPILWLGNQARIVGVVLTERATDVQFAMLTHDYVWRAFLVLLVLGLWLLWMKKPGFLPVFKRHIPAKGESRHPRLKSRKTKG
jgi:exosortase/archaeosortase family protein